MNFSNCLFTLVVTGLLTLTPISSFAQRSGQTQQASAPPQQQFISRCMGCHGRTPFGVSGHTDFPNLAGQNKQYLLNQLRNFRDGKRTDVTIGAMPAMIRDLSDNDLIGAADAFSLQPAEKVMASEMDADDDASFRRGKRIVMEDPKRNCRFCHLGGNGGAPASPDIPILVGQQTRFLYTQLMAFKSGNRVSPIMNADIVEGLTDQDFRDVATFFRYMRAQ